MTRISLVLWAMDFMYGLGFTLLAIGIVALVGFCAFAVIAVTSNAENPDEEKSSEYKKVAKYCAIATMSCFLLVSAIPSKCTCYAFIAGELMGMQQTKKLNNEALQIFEDVKTIIHKYAEDKK